MEVMHNEEDIPAQEAPSQDGTRLPQENGRQKRPQGSRPPQSKGQKAAFLLSSGADTGERLWL